MIMETLNSIPKSPKSELILSSLKSDLKTAPDQELSFVLLLSLLRIEQKKKEIRS